MARDMVSWLYGLQHFGVKLGLDNIRALLALLDHPERAYPSMIVGGTNGKGSVAAMVESMLGASGVATGLFTSPHLVRPNERIRIGGRDISDYDLERQLGEMRRRIEFGMGQGRLEAHPSFFEVVTATALQTFKETAMGAAVLEVGLGGRLDATNAVDAELSVVVSVDLDHTKTLGGTLELIAGEKAGIIKNGKPLVSGVVQQQSINVLQDVCARRGATLVDGRAHTVLVARTDDSFTLCTPRGEYSGLKLPLAGAHQIDNARIALTAFELFAERIGLSPDADAVRRGLAAVRWPGRLQWFDPADGGARLLLDAAHNPAGVRVLEAYLRTRMLPPAVLLFGATSGKPLDELLEPLSHRADRIVITRPPVDKGIDPAEIAAVAKRFFASVETVPDPARALEQARALAGPDRWVLVTGSLYLVGEILGKLTGADTPGQVAM